jgi:glycosyltransferase involved in cell wall biosynthesis
MKILVISTTVFPVPVKSYSGLEHLAWLIAEGLAKKHDVTLVAPRGSSCPGCAIHETTLRESEHLAYTGYAPILKDFDCVIDHSWEKWTVIGKHEGNCKAPVLCVCHAPIATMYGSAPPYPKPCFVGISEDHTQSIRDHLHIDARCAYNGVDLDFYQPLNLKRNDRYLFLARFSSIKGPDYAITSCLEAKKGLDLVGDDQITNEPGYKTQIEEACKVNPSLKYIGPQSREACVTWFNSNKCLLHPVFRFAEPFGLAPVEAQACGMPVITADNGAMRETIKHGETGFVVKSHAEITELIKTDAVSTIKAERCREQASCFSLQKMLDKYNELCIEAVDTGGW